MKHILLLLICLFSSSLYAQQWEWARQASSTNGKQSSKDVYSDNQGNVFMIGNNDTTVTYGSFNLSAGSFVTKYSPSGIILWAKQLPGEIQGLCADGAGNLFLMGNFSGAISLGTFNLLSNGGTDMYLAKVNSSGTFTWANAYGGTLNDRGKALEIDYEDNLFITGTFTNSISFDGITLTGGSVFLVKIKPTCITTWARISPYLPMFLAIDKNASSYIIGKGYQDSCQMYCTRYFIVRYDSAGVLTMNEMGWTFYHYLLGLTVDDSLNILVSYYSGQGSKALAKYDSLFNTKWIIGLGAYGYSQNYTYNYGLSTDSLNNIYMIGLFGNSDGSIDSAFVCGQWIYSKGYNDILVGKFDGTGNCIWIKTAGGVGNVLLNYSAPEAAMYVNKSGTCYLSGNFNAYTWNEIQNDTLAFDNDTLRNDGNWQQIYLAKIPSTNPLTSTVQLSSFDQFDLSIYPNPSTGRLSIKFPELINVKVSVIDVLGKSIYVNDFKNITVANIELIKQLPGVYFVEVISENQRWVKKLIIE